MAKKYKFSSMKGGKEIIELIDVTGKKSKIEAVHKYEIDMLMAFFNDYVLSKLTTGAPKNNEFNDLVNKITTLTNKLKDAKPDELEYGCNTGFNNNRNKEIEIYDNGNLILKDTADNIIKLIHNQILDIYVGQFNKGKEFKEKFTVNISGKKFKIFKDGYYGIINSGPPGEPTKNDQIFKYYFLTPPACFTKVYDDINEIMDAIKLYEQSILELPPPAVEQPEQQFSEILETNYENDFSLLKELIGKSIDLLKRHYQSANVLYTIVDATPDLSKIYSNLKFSADMIDDALVPNDSSSDLVSSSQFNETIAKLKKKISGIGPGSALEALGLSYIPEKSKFSETIIKMYDDYKSATKLESSSGINYLLNASIFLKDGQKRVEYLDKDAKQARENEIKDENIRFYDNIAQKNPSRQQVYKDKYEPKKIRQNQTGGKRMKFKKLSKPVTITQSGGAEIDMTEYQYRQENDSQKMENLVESVNQYRRDIIKIDSGFFGNDELVGLKNIGQKNDHLTKIIDFILDNQQKAKSNDEAWKDTMKEFKEKKNELSGKLTNYLQKKDLAGINKSLSDIMGFLNQKNLGQTITKETSMLEDIDIVSKELNDDIKETLEIFQRIAKYYEPIKKINETKIKQLQNDIEKVYNKVENIRTIIQQTKTNTENIKSNIGRSIEHNIGIMNQYIENVVNITNIYEKRANRLEEIDILKRSSENRINELGVFVNQINKNLIDYKEDDINNASSKIGFIDGLFTIYNNYLKSVAENSKKIININEVETDLFRLRKILNNIGEAQVESIAMLEFIFQKNIIYYLISDVDYYKDDDVLIDVKTRLDRVLKNSTGLAEIKYSPDLFNGINGIADQDVLEDIYADMINIFKKVAASEVMFFPKILRKLNIPYDIGYLIDTFVVMDLNLLKSFVKVFKNPTTILGKAKESLTVILHRIDSLVPIYLTIFPDIKQGDRIAIMDILDNVKKYYKKAIDDSVFDKVFGELTKLVDKIQGIKPGNIYETNEYVKYMKEKMDSYFEIVAGNDKIGYIKGISKKFSLYLIEAIKEDLYSNFSYLNSLQGELPSYSPTIYNINSILEEIDNLGLPVDFNKIIGLYNNLSIITGSIHAGLDQSYRKITRELEKFEPTEITNKDIYQYKYSTVNSKIGQYILCIILTNEKSILDIMTKVSESFNDLISYSEILSAVMMELYTRVSASYDNSKKSKEALPKMVSDYLGQIRTNFKDTDPYPKPDQYNTTVDNYFAGVETTIQGLLINDATKVYNNFGTNIEFSLNSKPTINQIKDNIIHSFTNNVRDKLLLNITYYIYLDFFSILKNNSEGKINKCYESIENIEIQNISSRFYNKLVEIVGKLNNLQIFDPINIGNVPNGNSKANNAKYSIDETRTNETSFLLLDNFLGEFTAPIHNVGEYAKAEYRIYNTLTLVNAQIDTENEKDKRYLSNKLATIDEFYYLATYVIFNEVVSRKQFLGKDELIQNITMINTVYGNLQKSIEKNIADAAKAKEKYDRVRSQFFGYTNFVLMSGKNPEKKKYYQKMSLGLIEFYFDTIYNIIYCISNKTYEEMGNVEKYLYANHYIQLKQIFHLFNWLVNTYQSDKLKRESQLKEAGTFDPKNAILNQKIRLDRTKDEVRKIFATFNALKNLFDDYRAISMPPVALHLRINDFYKEPTGSKEYDKNYDPRTLEYSQLWNSGKQIFYNSSTNKNELKVNFSLAQEIEDDAGRKEDLEDKYDSVAAKMKGDRGIKFERIYNSIDYPNADIISNYMSLGTNLDRLEGAILMTYGYSGVGKSATLFGVEENLSKGIQGKLGILQTTLDQFGDNAKIFLRIYEIYGLGTQYNFYWNPEKDSQNECFPDFYQILIHHQINASDPNKLVTEDEVIPIPNRADAYVYIMAMQNPAEKPSEKIEKGSGWYRPEAMKRMFDQNGDFITKPYAEIKRSQYENFSSFIEKYVESKRSSGFTFDQVYRHLLKQVKGTVNNDKSSRSILVYDFQIGFLNADKTDYTYVPFIIYDLPGKEDIFRTYVLPNPSNVPNADMAKFTFKDIPSDINENNKISKGGHDYIFKEKKSSYILNPLIIPSFGNNIDYIIPLLKDLDNTLSSEMIGSLMGSVRNFSVRYDGYPYSNGNLTIEPSKEIRIGEMYKTEPNNFNDLFNSKNLDVTLEQGGIPSQNDIGRVISGDWGMIIYLNNKYYTEKNPNVFFKPLFSYITVIVIKALIDCKLFDVIVEIIYRSVNNGKDIDDNLEDGSWTRSKIYSFFEAYYINENVIGLLQYLLNIIKPDDTIFEEQDDLSAKITVGESYRKALMYSFVEENSKTDKLVPITVPGIKIDENLINSTNPKMKNEISQFMKDFNINPDGSYFIQGKKKYRETFEIMKGNISYDNRGSYDSNKIFRNGKKQCETDTSKKIIDPFTGELKIEQNYPLLKDFIEPYRKKVSYYYVFYVVSNVLKKLKAEEQIKLLNNSIPFINAFNVESLGTSRCDVSYKVPGEEEEEEDEDEWVSRLSDYFRTILDGILASELTTGGGSKYNIALRKYIEKIIGNGTLKPGVNIKDIEKEIKTMSRIDEDDAIIAILTNVELGQEDQIEWQNRMTLDFKSELDKVMSGQSLDNYNDALRFYLNKRDDVTGLYPGKHIDFMMHAVKSLHEISIDRVVNMDRKIIRHLKKELVNLLGKISSDYLRLEILDAKKKYGLENYLDGYDEALKIIITKNIPAGKKLMPGTSIENILDEIKKLDKITEDDIAGIIGSNLEGSTGKKIITPPLTQEEEKEKMKKILKGLMEKSPEVQAEALKKILKTIKEVTPTLPPKKPWTTKMDESFKKTLETFISYDNLTQGDYDGALISFIKDKISGKNLKSSITPKDIADQVKLLDSISEDIVRKIIVSNLAELEEEEEEYEEDEEKYENSWVGGLDDTLWNALTGFIKSEGKNYKNMEVNEVEQYATDFIKSLINGFIPTGKSLKSDVTDDKLSSLIISKAYSNGINMKYIRDLVSKNIK